jgi:hypothetical protein
MGGRTSVAVLEVEDTAVVVVVAINVWKSAW